MRALLATRCVLRVRDPVRDLLASDGLDRRGERTDARGAT
jgi:hypothetical protein